VWTAMAKETGQVSGTLQTMEAKGAGQAPGTLQVMPTSWKRKERRPGKRLKTAWPSIGIGLEE
jgi:hypothetical protein